MIGEQKATEGVENCFVELGGFVGIDMEFVEPDVSQLGIGRLDEDEWVVAKVVERVVGIVADFVEGPEALEIEADIVGRGFVCIGVEGFDIADYYNLVVKVVLEGGLVEALANELVTCIVHNAP